MKKRLAAGCMLLVGIAATIESRADAPKGVTLNLIGRGTYQPFTAPGDGKSLDLLVESRRPVDIVVRMHDYAPGSSTGWHTHPGPVFITVLEGSVTFYEYDDAGCKPKVVKKGEGYVDSGRGHIGRNETGAPARDVTVFFAPVAGTFRGELAPPAGKCGF